MGFGGPVWCPELAIPIRCLKRSLTCQVWMFDDVCIVRPLEKRHAGCKLSHRLQESYMGFAHGITSSTAAMIGTMISPIKFCGMATRHRRCLQVRMVVLYNGCPSPTTNFLNPKRVVPQYKVRLGFQQTSRRTLKSSIFPVSKSSSSMFERGSNPQPFPISVYSFSPNRLPNSIATSRTATTIVPPTTSIQAHLENSTRD